MNCWPSRTITDMMTMIMMISYLKAGAGMNCWLRRTITDMMAMIHLRNYHIQVRKTAAEISNDVG